MALVADAFSHLALPGIAAGFLLHFAPALGAFVMLVVGVLVISALESDRHVAPETTLGVLFTAALAVGMLMMPDAESLMESLFGDIMRMTYLSAYISLVGGLLLAGITIYEVRDFALLTLSPELAHTSGVNIRTVRIAFFLVVAFAVALGIQFMGILLMGALIVLPAAIAKNISPNLRIMFMAGAAISAVSVVGGIVMADKMHWLPGPAVVIVLTVLFGISLLFRKG